MGADDRQDDASAVDERRKWIALALLLVQNAITPIIFRYATTEVSLAEKFDTSVAVTVQEVIKLSLSLVLYLREVGWDLTAFVSGLRHDIVEQPSTTLKLGVPAFLYFVQNSCLQIGSANLPAAVFQVLYQGKTLVVAVCSVMMLNKLLTRAKWLALALMSAGIAMVQLGAGKETQQALMGNSADQNIQIGLFVVIIGCLCSGFSGVYFEMMMKPQPNADGSLPKPASMWIRNVQLAFFSMLIGFTQMVLSNTGSISTDAGLLHGFTPKVWYMVLNNAVGGLLVAMVIKYADNLMKGFAAALATVVATFLSVPLFGYEIGLTFFLGVCVVLYSTMLYAGTVKLTGAGWDKELEICASLRGTSLPTDEEFEACITDVLEDVSAESSLNLLVDDDDEGDKME